jgi:CRISPR-associated protein Cst2
MNLAKALTPYRHNSVFTQSPLSTKDSAYKNSDSSALLHRETTDTAFQYPFGLNLEDCRKGKDGAKWSRALLEAIGELSGVAGNHARSLYEMAPASIVARLGNSLVAGYNLYGFNANGGFPEVVDGLLREPADYPAGEFYLGGKIVKDMDDATVQKLTAKGVTLDRDPRRLIATLADKANLKA